VDNKDIVALIDKTIKEQQNKIIFEGDIIEFKDNKIIGLSENNNIIELIKKLSELYNNGILTEEEFKNKKTELLAKI
jgi:hypothetical protein